MKKIVCLILCLAFCVSVFAGCGLKEDEKGSNIRVYLSDYPYTLDPAVIQVNSDVEQILSMIFEPLTTIDENGKVQPALAEKWYYDYDEIWQEHRMYFELKETAWSDNYPVTADDVVYAWRRILDPAMDSPYAALLYPIKGARSVKAGVTTIDDLGLAAVDDTLLEVTFEDEYDVELFAQLVANVHLAPCRENIVTRYEKQGEDWAGSATNIVCNGKFRVQTMEMPRPEREDEENYPEEFACKLVLERNAYYERDIEKHKLDKFVTPYRITCLYFEGQYSYYKDEQGKTQKVFQSDLYDMGEIYYLSSFEKSTYERYEKDLETQQTLNGFSFYFNTENEILSDANVRKALSFALDREAIVNNVTGTGEVVATGFVPTGVFNTGKKDDFRKVGGDLISTDMDKAKSLIKGKRGELTITCLDPVNAHTVKEFKKYIDYNNVYENVAKKAAEDWGKLGLTVKVEAVEPDEYIRRLTERDYDIIGVNVLAGSVDAFAYLAPFAKEYSGTASVVNNDVANYDEVFSKHYTNIDSKKYSDLITKALKTGDRAARADVLHQAEKMLVEELCPATMVFWYSRSYVSSNKLSGIKTDSRFGYVDFGDVQLKNWRKVNEEESIALAERDSK